VPGADPFVEVCVFSPVPGRYTYRLPAHLDGRAQVGSRVLVRFGNRAINGVVVRVGVTPPEGVTPVELSELLEPAPSLSGELVELCLWIADYYEAPPGEVLRGALPAGTQTGVRSVYALTAAGRAAAEGQGAAIPAKQRAKAWS